MRQGEPKEAKFLGFSHDVLFSHWEGNPLGESQLEDHFLIFVFFGVPQQLWGFSQPWLKTGLLECRVPIPSFCSGWGIDPHRLLPLNRVACHKCPHRVPPEWWGGLGGRPWTEGIKRVKKTSADFPRRIAIPRAPDPTCSKKKQRRQRVDASCVSCCTDHSWEWHLSEWC